jgi:hypothetical protein
MNERDDYGFIFSKLYENSIWGGLSSPKSGSGSTITAAAPYLYAVREFIRNTSIHSVLDIGHGDWEMWGEYKFENVSYTGIDVYEDLSRKLTKSFGSERRKFLARNAVTEELPLADLCITKDVLQHLPTHDVIKVLGRLTDFKYVVICNDFYKINPSESLGALRRFFSIRERATIAKSGKNPFYLKLKKTNGSILVGEHRCLNLSVKPFAEYLSQHTLLYTIDFVGKDEKRPNIVKRIYFYERK